MENNVVNIQKSAPDVIFDVSTADFEDKVIKASMEKPVLVDFWAPWCGPCKQLMPVLEKLVNAAGGEVLLAKINLDENQQLAAALQVQSVPAVFAFFGGRPIEAFQGLQPESTLKTFIEKLVQVARQSKPDAIDIPESLKLAAEALSVRDFGTAQGLYLQILDQDENNAAAYVGLVRLFLAAGEVEQAASWVANAPADIAKKPAFAEAKTALELAQSTPSGDLGALEAAVQKKPKDHQARYDLAMAQFAAGRREAAIDSLIEIMTLKRDWNNDAARLQLLKFFEAMGHSDPVTIEGRRKLSTLLFS